MFRYGWIRITTYIVKHILLEKITNISFMAWTILRSFHKTSFVLPNVSKPIFVCVFLIQMGKLEWIIGISIVAVIVIVYARVIYYRPCVQADTFFQKGWERIQTVKIEEFFNVKKEYVTTLGITTNGLPSTLYSRKTDLLRKPLTISPSSGWTGSVYIVECFGNWLNDSLFINKYFLPKQWKQRKVYGLHRNLSMKITRTL